MRIDIQEVDIKARRRARRMERLAHGGRTRTRVLEDKKKKREKYKRRFLDEC